MDTNSYRRERIDYLYARHGERLFSIARRITGNSDDAADVVHDAVCKALRTQAFPTGEHEYAWLCQVVRNAAKDLNRKKRAYPSLHGDLQRAFEIPDEREDLPFFMKWDKLQIALFLSSLPPKHARILELKALGASYADISEELSINEAHVGAKVQLALNAARKVDPSSLDLTPWLELFSVELLGRLAYEDIPETFRMQISEIFPRWYAAAWNHNDGYLDVPTILATKSIGRHLVNYQWWDHHPLIDKSTKRHSDFTAFKLKKAIQPKLAITKESVLEYSRPDVMLVVDMLEMGFSEAQIVLATRVSPRKISLIRRYWAECAGNIVRVSGSDDSEAGTEWNRIFCARIHQCYRFVYPLAIYSTSDETHVYEERLKCGFDLSRLKERARDIRATFPETAEATRDRKDHRIRFDSSARLQLPEHIKNQGLRFSDSVREDYIYFDRFDYYYYQYDFYYDRYEYEGWRVFTKSHPPEGGGSS